MLEHTVEQVKQTKKYFEKQNYKKNYLIIGGREIEYYVAKKNFNLDLKDFVYRASNTAEKIYTMAVSESIPENLRPYFALEEFIEFMEKGIGYKKRVLDSEKETLKFVPEELKKDYLDRRIKLFERELELNEQQPEKYALNTEGDNGCEEFENNLKYLRQELEKIN